MMESMEGENLASLGGLFAPRSIAVIGATGNPGKWGHQYAKSLLAAEHRRRVYLVNERGESVLDRPTFRTIAELPETPEVVVLCVPAARVEAAAAAAVARGAKFLICITAGFSETGEGGQKAQERLVNLVRDAGARLVGPNCLGVYDAAAELACIAFWDMRPGSVGLVSQSGGNLYELSGRLADHGHGVSRAVSVGNQADLTIADYLSTFAEHPETRAVVAYIEDFRDGRALFSAVDRVVAGGKPVVLLVPGGSEAVMRAASSHTGALVSSDALIDAACADSGALRVRSVADAVVALRGILSPRRAAGRRVAVISDVGGGAVLGADAVTEAGLIVPSLSQALQEKIRPHLGPGSGITNPIDAVGVYSLGDMLPAVEAIAASGEVDSIFMTGVLSNVKDAPDATQEAEVGKRLADVGRRQSLQLVVSSSLPEEPAVRAIAKEGIPTFLYAKDAAQCLRLSTEAVPRRNVPEINNVPRKLPSLATDYFAARALFAEYGVNLSTARAVRTIQEALAAASEIGYPVALKGLGSIHKSDSGAVALNLSSGAELAARFEEIEKRLAPPEFSVEQMVDSKNAVEILVGALRDRSFGPTVAVGIGGIFAEILRDTVVALAPVTEAYARDMLLQLRGAAILQGFRGRPKPDLDALARNVAAVSRLIAECTEISEAELNPVFAMPTGAVAVDARIALVS